MEVVPTNTVVESPQEHSHANTKMVEEAADFIQMAAQLIAQKAIEGLLPNLQAINRRIERIEERLVGHSANSPDGSFEPINMHCSAPGCLRPARARGLCSAHYQRVRYQEKKVTETELGQKGELSPDKICSVEGCGRVIKARGLCSAHYQQRLYHEHRTTTTPE
jgi:hypothetical protein